GVVPFCKDRYMDRSWVFLGLVIEMRTSVLSYISRSVEVRKREENCHRRRFQIRKGQRLQKIVTLLEFLLP
ncbi:hypothetical protein VIGAN_09202800, partial [Vigna angularis var. angularis]